MWYILGETVKYRIEKSFRKTCTIQVNIDGTVVVRAPLFMPERKIRQFVLKKTPWIIKTKEKLDIRKQQISQVNPITRSEIEQLGKLALEIIPKKVEYYSKILQVQYNRITIRNQKTRFGSCSSKGNLNFNCIIMLMPEQVQDYVVVHELCHLKFMNHSSDFWAEVEACLPQYKIPYKWLKQNGYLYIEGMLKSSEGDE